MDHTFHTLAVELAELEQVYRNKLHAANEAQRELELAHARQESVTRALVTLGYNPEAALEYGQQELV